MKAMPVMRFPCGRLLVLLALVLLTGCKPGVGDGSGNSLLVLMPYQHAGTWVFDDPGRGLKQEPFVAGIPQMIDRLVKDIPDAGKGFRLIFSAQPFPGSTHQLIWKRQDPSGNWYYCPQFDTEGWLCPALFKYFKQAPPEIHVKAEAK